MRHPLRLLPGLLALATITPFTALTADAMAAASAEGYVTDSRGIPIRASYGECWRSSSWTPALATVVGCDGVLAKALPVPAPATARSAPPEKRVPESAQAAPPTTAAPAPTPGAEPQAGVAPDSARPTPSAAAVPVVPVPSAGLAPDADSRADAKPGPRSEKVTLDTDTYFDFDKATLKPDGRRKLDELATRLAGMRLEVVVATGHTDAIGTQQYNQDLSMRRAHAVRALLEDKGLPVEKIFTTGKGETQPVASNQSLDGRAKNRRVEVEVVGIRETR